jgi:hypothetical protein
MAHFPQSVLLSAKAKADELEGFDSATPVFKRQRPTEAADANRKLVDLVFGARAIPSKRMAEMSQGERTAAVQEIARAGGLL